jgi:prepilin-type N-terminal cleavage/methylation domain-containing protein
MFSSGGFTLVELLVVIAIIGVLSTIGLVSFQTASRKARDGKRQGDLSQVRAALELYRAQLNTYPSTSSYPSMTGTLSTAGYLAAPIPADPKGAPYTQYSYTSTGNTFCMCAALEIAGSGNATGNAAAACPLAPSGNFYCVIQP